MQTFYLITENNIKYHLILSDDLKSLSSDKRNEGVSVEDDGDCRWWISVNPKGADTFNNISTIEFEFKIQDGLRCLLPYRALFWNEDGLETEGKFRIVYKKKRNEHQNSSGFIWNTTSKKKDIKVGDCVIRAISLALNMTWEDVYKSLCKIGLEEYRMPNDKLVYGKFLKDQGFDKQKMLHKKDETRYKCSEFAKEFEGVYILNVRKHLTCIINHKIHDTWDCGRYTVGNFWKIK